MAAPMRCFMSFRCQTQCGLVPSNLRNILSSAYNRNAANMFSNRAGSHFKAHSRFSGTFSKSWTFLSKRYMLLTTGVGVSVLYLADMYRRTSVIFADEGGPFHYKPIRRVRSDGDSTDLKLTMFQYQTCPFCCKARAYLDSRNFSYDVVEVNSVWRKEIKWSKYRKVPILVVRGVGPDGYLQINDSSIIISVLETFLENRDLSLEKVLEYYPVLESKDKQGKITLEYPNKYFIMMKDRKMSPALENEQKEERQWREWTDEVLMHTLAPNMYRTLREAKQAFDYFSEVGEWQKVFTTSERLFVIYVGTVAMYILGKLLKKRYSLKSDVRASLYDACREWIKAIGPERQFLGGSTPNLADISVYGVLSSFEGCKAFTDVLNNTDIGQWYAQMRKYIDGHKGHVLPE